MKWTNEQQRAITERGNNIIVSAAAGSGKTAVLSERIVRLVIEGADIGRFLVVTFTQSATNEMKQRIAKNLMDASLLQDDAGIAERLRTQSLAVGRANISTLHSFCLYILRRNFHKLELDPAFTTADAILSAMLFDEALNQAASEAYAREDKGFMTLLGAFMGKEDVVFEHTKRLHTFLMARPSPWDWLDEAVELYTSGGEDILEPLHTESFRSKRTRTRAHVNRLACVRACVPKDYTKVLALLDDDMATLRAVGMSDNFDVYKERIEAVKFGRFSGWPKDKDDELLKKQVTGERNAVKDDIAKQKKELAMTPEEELAPIKEMAPAIFALAAFVKEVDAAYTELKRARAKVDFSDMEHLALKALEDDEIRSALTHRFDYVFVDEYQDSSLIQERIVSRVCRGNNLFLVGDVKQSIYRFRQAEPSLFLQKLKEYDGGDGGTAIHLNTNYRSCKPIIDTVNELFSGIMTEEVGEIKYDGNAKLRGADDEMQSGLDGVELHMVDMLADQGGQAEQIIAAEAEDEAEYPEDEDDEQPIGEVEAEAILAARRIHELMANEKYIEKGQTRSLRYSDFTVLLRLYKRSCAVWASTLARAGIPAYVQLTGGYFDAIEVQIFLNLLRVIDNRRQDVPLASVLRSPIFDFDESALIELATDYGADTLFDSLTLCAKGEGGLCEKARNALNEIERWRQESLLLPLNEFVAQLLDECRLYECMGALMNGSERQSNLDALSARAREYIGAGGACDLCSFLKYMDGVKNSANMGPATPGAKDVVRVMSVHKAKGLQFPVVILAGLANNFVTKGAQANLLFDDELKIGARLVVGGRRKDTSIRAAIASSMKRKDIAEEMRVLYVGMTRAKKRLIMIGSCNDARERLMEAKNIVFTSTYCAQARSYLDWLLPIAARGNMLNTQVNPRESYAALQEEAQKSDPDIIEAIRERFNWRYPHGDAICIPSKLSVSELLRDKRETVLRDPPAFVREQERLTPAQIGTATHVFMKEAAYTFDGPATAHVRRELDRLLAHGALSPSQARAIRADDIAWFLESETSARLRRSSRVERELEFSTELPANTLMDTKSDEPILLQGVIDCCFIEDGEWVLIDYKTDRVQDEANELALTHAPQLKLYARALEKLTGMGVKESLVVMLRARKTVKLA